MSGSLSGDAVHASAVRPLRQHHSSIRRGVCAAAHLAARPIAVAGRVADTGQRTVCGILRIVGLRRERHFVTYHRVLNRTV